MCARPYVLVDEREQGAVKPEIMNVARSPAVLRAYPPLVPEQVGPTDRHIFGLDNAHQNYTFIAPKEDDRKFAERATLTPRGVIASGKCFCQEKGESL